MFRSRSKSMPCAPLITRVFTVSSGKRFGIPTWKILRLPLRTMPESSLTIYARNFYPADFLLIRSFQFPNPNIAEANRVAVILKRERQFLGVRRIRRTRLMRRWAREFDVALGEHAVMQQ